MIHGFVGRRKVGKTTLSDHLCRQMAFRIRFSPRITLPEHPNSVNMIHAPHSMEIAEHFANNRTITIVPENDVNECFLVTARSVRRWYSNRERQGPHTVPIGFIVDEARFKAVRDSEDLDWLFRNTDQDMMHVYLTVHRPKDLHPDIRAILDRWYVFHVSQRIDLDVLEDETQPLIATHASTLKKREFFRYDVEEDTIEWWKNSRKSCESGEHHQCSHLWRPIAEPTKVRMQGPTVPEAHDDDDFELTEDL